MNDLIPIIEQAEDNGFDLFSFCNKHNVKYTGMYDGITWQLWSLNLIDLLLLNKEFNKAYWGEAIVFNPTYEIPVWQYHLQQIVLEDNKVEYFKKGLK